MSDVVAVEFDEHVMVHDGEEWVVYRGDEWLASFALPEDAEEYADRKRLEP